VSWLFKRSPVPLRRRDLLSVVVIIACLTGLIAPYLWGLIW
jgi:hypothetical protein